MVWEAAHHLARAHEVSVVAAQIDEMAPGIRTVEVAASTAGGSLAPLRFRLAATRALAALPADVVVSFGADCPPGRVLVMQSVHRAWLELGQPVRLGPLHVPAVGRRFLLRHQVRLALEWWTLRRHRPEVIVTVSDNVAADLRRLYHLPAESIEVLANGFDPAQCNPARRASARDGMRRELGLGPAEIVLLFVANEYHRKGLAVLLDAMAALDDPRLRLLLVGRMAPTAFQGRIDELGLSRQVRYCGSTDDVALYHAAADLFVLPTQYEAFGSVIVEALASGLPVITTARAGAATLVRPGTNGLLQQDPGDSGELERLLRQALEPDTLRRWSAAAPESVTGYEWPTVMERMERIICAHAAAT